MLTSKQSLKILLVEDDPVYIELIEDLLGSVSHTQFKVKAVQRLGEGLKCLSEADFDAILLDLSLPDSFGIDTIVSMKMQAPALPIVILTALNDRDVAIEAVRAGAQDYLMKGQFQRELLVRSISYSIERQRTEDALRQVAERERLLGRMIERIRQSIDLTEILQTTVAEVRHFLKTDRVLIYRCQLSESEIPFEQFARVIAGDVGAFEGFIWKPDVYANFAMSCLESEDFQLFHAVENVKKAELNPDYKNLLADFQVKAVLTVPIWQTRPQRSSASSPIHNQLWGLLMAHNCCEDRQWQQWEVDFLNQLASQVAIAIQQSQLYRQLEIANQKLLQLASTDALTGIANRRQFEGVLQEEWQRLARERSPLSLILCDIDYFKLYNDTMGHLAGDECLQRVAHVIAKTVQILAADRGISIPLVARYGGEEFAAIFPNTDCSEAGAIAEKLRQQIQILQIFHPSSPINSYVTLSWGITTTIPDCDRSPDTLIQVADSALYQAKAQGKDCICQARYPCSL